MTHYEDEEDCREPSDIPADEPIGSARVSFDVPMPTIQQVTGEIARQVLGQSGYYTKPQILKHAEAALDELILKLVTEAATPVIQELLSKPIQPTDGFGNPVGEPTNLHGVLGARISRWASEPVDREGKPTKPDHYNRTAPRISWALGNIVDGELSKQVDAEVRKITATLKASATQSIAKQIADKVSAMVFK